MKSTAHAKSPSLSRVRLQRAPSIVRTLDEARSIYVQSTSRIELAGIAQAFKGAPDMIDQSGKSRKGC